MKLTYNRVIRRIFVAVLLTLSAGCASGIQNLAVLPADDLYATGTTAFEGGRWRRAITYLETFVNAHIGDPRAPDARLKLGQAHMGMREYATAATHFERLAIDFPSSPLNLQARFLICESYYRLSPRPALDQEFTVSSLLHCQSIGEIYPGTAEALQAAGYVIELQEKLARKIFENGDFYFRRRAYDSAVVYYQEVLNQYPNTTFAPAALAQLIETYTRIGYVEDAEESRTRLRTEYPQSPEAQALGS
jgi:outer membrane protein assembly factor BamD